MVLLIYVAGWILFRRPDWFLRSGVFGYVVMLSMGFLLALIVEWLGLHILRRWQYTENMPLLPGLRLGIVPIAQMLFLPPLVFQILGRLAGRGNREDLCPRRVIRIETHVHYIQVSPGSSRTVFASQACPVTAIYSPMSNLRSRILCASD